MSDVTEIRTDSGAAIQWCPGHLPYGDAVNVLRRHLERQLQSARDGLADIEAGRIRVTHQSGVYVARREREVLPS